MASASRNITDFFTPKPKPSEALNAAAEDDDIVCITPIERREIHKELKKVEEKKAGRTAYRKYTKTERAEIGKYAALHGVGKAMRKYEQKYPGIKQQSVSDFKRKYKELKSRDPLVEVNEIGTKKQGRPSLLPEELMKKSIDIIKALRLKAAPVSYSVMAAVARGVVISHDRSLLVENGGHLKFSDNWAKQILYKVMKDGKKMVVRMGNTASMPVDPAILSEVKLDFQRKIKHVYEEHNIPDDLILNFDQTPLAYICGSNRTMDFQGATSVPIVGKGKKQQITGTFTITKSGIFLPMQLIYKGKTDRSLPRGINFPDGFDLTYTENHWSNEEKCMQHIEKIVLPYLKSKREELALRPDQKALLIFDVFKGQKTDRYRALLEMHDIVAVYVPANMTKYFQPLDLTINGVAKTFLKDKFGTWYAGEVSKQLENGTDIYSVDIKLQLSVLKPIHARWLISLYDHLRNKPELIVKGFDQAGISDALHIELENEDPFEDLL